MTMKNGVPRVLLADDSDDDVFLMKRAFSSAGVDASLEVARDGEETIDCLESRVRSGTDWDEVPDILLLDLKMPRKGGFEVLEWVRSHRRLRRLVVIVMTSSMAQADVDRAYDLGVNGFLVKPSEYAELVAMTRRLVDFWIKDNRPPRCRTD